MKKRIIKRVAGLIQRMRTLLYAAMSTGNSIGQVWKIQPVLILGNGVVEFKKNVKLGFSPSPYFFSGYIHLEARDEDSRIVIGEGTHINNNFVAIVEHTSITIGKRCLIGTNVEIIDSDFHGVRLSTRDISTPALRSKPVVIGDDVFIGSNVKIMKGVTIGCGSVIANSAVVVGEIPANVIAGGNPARVLKENEV